MSNTEILRAVREGYREAYIKDRNVNFDKDIDGLLEEFTEMSSSSVTVEGVKVGWYQNSDGGLFHYDGVVWDVVPDEKISRLEYLG